MNSNTGQKVTLENNLTYNNNSGAAALHAYQGYQLANGSARDSTKLPTSGGTMTGALTLNNNLILSNNTYGDTLPNTGTEGQLFFLQPDSENLTATTILTEDVTITTGDTLYQNFYYGDANFTTIRPTMICITNVSYNRPAFIQLLSSMQVRVYTSVANTTVTIRGIQIGLEISSAAIATTTTSNGITVIKFQDGTMIQKAKDLVVTGNGNMAQIASTGIYFGTIGVSLPEPFINANFISANGSTRYSTGYSLPAGLVSTTTNGLVFHAYDFYQRPLADNNLKLTFTAIGRWK